jgi:cytochrome c oxidase subunit 4
MSTITHETTATPDDVPSEHVHTHPSDLQYVKIAAILAVLTGLEVSTYFWQSIFGSNLSTTGAVLILFPMMIVKFAIVVSYFMHLKYDNPLFRRVFVGGLLLAVTVYLIAMTTFGFWSQDYLKFLRS